jgi:hypothetical protein
MPKPAVIPALEEASSVSRKSLKTRIGAPLPAQAVPTSWMNQSMYLDFFELVPTDSLTAQLQSLMTATYKQVKTRDRGENKMPTSLEIVTVQRVENRKLWQSYAEAKAAVKGMRSHKCTPLSRLNGGGVATTEHMKAHGLGLVGELDATVNEAFLWHGTSPSGMQAIAKGGFKMDLAGSHAGTMYGPGAYFAECSSKSDEYGRDDKDGIYSGLNCLLLCRVVLGEPMPIQVAGTSVHETIEVAMNSGAWNSVLGDRQAAVGTYREFVVYAEDQVYPEFAIIYKRKYD